MRSYRSTERVLRRLADLGSPAFSNRDFRRLFRFSKKAADMRLYDLTRTGVLRRVLHGWYAVRGPDASEVLAEPRFLGTRLVEPSYVAFGSALHFYGWTRKTPPVTSIASPRRSRLPRVGGHPVEVVHLPPFRFFGSTLARRGRLTFPVAEPEKAIVDAFYHPRHCGGMGRVIAAVEKARPSLDLERLEAYAVRMDVRSLCSRLGYVLETLGEEPRSLLRHASRIPVKLNPQGPRKGPRVERWHLIENL